MVGFIFRLKQTLSIFNTSNWPNITYYTTYLEGVLGLSFRDLEGVLGLSFRDLKGLLGLSFRDLEGFFRS